MRIVVWLLLFCICTVVVIADRRDSQWDDVHSQLQAIARKHILAAANNNSSFFPFGKEAAEEEARAWIDKIPKHGLMERECSSSEKSHDKAGDTTCWSLVTRQTEKDLESNKNE